MTSPRHLGPDQGAEPKAIWSIVVGEATQRWVERTGRRPNDFFKGLLRFQPSQLERGVEEADVCLRVDDVDRALAAQRGQERGRREGPHGEALGSLELLLPRPQALGEVNMHAMRRGAGDRKELRQRPQARRGVAGLFLELSSGAGRRVLSFLED